MVFDELTSLAEHFLGHLSGKKEFHETNTMCIGAIQIVEALFEKGFCLLLHFLAISTHQ